MPRGQASKKSVACSVTIPSCSHFVPLRSTTASIASLLDYASTFNVVKAAGKVGEPTRPTAPFKLCCPWMTRLTGAMRLASPHIPSRFNNRGYRHDASLGGEDRASKIKVRCQDMGKYAPIGYKRNSPGLWNARSRGSPSKSPPPSKNRHHLTPTSALLDDSLSVGNARQSA
jgi:hypothetical protein